jgi:hypothetical protein
LADANVLTINLVGPNPSTSGGFIQTAGGAVVNWPATGGVVVRTWTGVVSSDWSDPNNWNPVGLPGVTDSVVIPQVSNAPVDTATATPAVIGSLVITGDLSLTLSGSVGLSIAGDLVAGSLQTGGAIDPGTRAGTPVVVLAGTGRSVSGFVNVDMTIGGSYHLSGPVTMNQPATLIVSGSLDLNGQQMTLGGNFGTSGPGTLTMTHPADTLRVGGFVSFAGGSTAGKLTDGALIVGADFQQFGTQSGESYAPSANHWTILDGTLSQPLLFQTPGSTAGTSSFRNLLITNSDPAGGVTVESDVYITGTSAIVVPAVQIVNGNGNVVHLANLDVNNTTFNNVLLAYDAALGGSDTISITNATFQNYDPNGTTPIISISHPGALSVTGGPITYNFTNLTFGSVIGSGTGTYLSATDTNPSDGVPLTIFVTSNLNNPEGPNHTVTQPVPTAPGAPVITWSVP